MQERLEKNEYEKIFTGGGCWHFAWELAELLGNKAKIFGLKDEKSGFHHVWVEYQGSAIDVTGIAGCQEYHINLCQKYLKPGSDITDVSRDCVKAESESDRFSEEMNKRISKTAKWVIERDDKILSIR